MVAVLAAACSADAAPVEQSDDAIVGVPQTDIERQTIGSVWLYAHTRWAKAMHARATGADDLEVAPVYLAYWHWFDQVATGISPRIQTGGNWQLASSLVRRYGLCPPSAFGTTGAFADDASRFADALATVEASLASGPLRDPARRRDRRVVRAELDRAFRLDDQARSMLDRVFGEDVARTFASTSQPADATGTPLLRAEDVRVSYPGGALATSNRQTLAVAMNEWRSVYYATEDHRAFLQRMQRAMNDRAPVLLTWFVDFGGLERREVPLRGSFALATLRELGPGTQGGHTAVVDAYTALLADGSKVSVASDQAPPAGALDPYAEVVSVRVAREWGAARPPAVDVPGMPAHHELFVDYLTSSIKRCVVRDGATDTKNCPFSQIPLESILLPPGY